MSVRIMADQPAMSNWDQPEADRLLAQLRSKLAEVEKVTYRGKVPTAAAHLAADGLAIAEGWIANHEAEAARGWDVLDLLRGMVKDLPDIVRGDRLKGAQT